MRNTHGKLGEGKELGPSDYRREGTRRMNVLNVGDPRPGISFGECPRDKGAERSDQEEPEQALESVSRATCERELGYSIPLEWRLVK